MKRIGNRLARAIALLVVCATALGAEVGEIKVLSAGAVRAIVTELAEAFRQETGHTVKLTFGTVGELRQKLVAGEAADVAILTDAATDQVATQGVVAAGTRTDIARVGIGVGVREGAPRPDISTPEAFKAKFAEAGLDYRE